MITINGEQFIIETNGQSDDIEFYLIDSQGEMVSEDNVDLYELVEQEFANELYETWLEDRITEADFYQDYLNNK